MKRITIVFASIALAVSAALAQATEGGLRLNGYVQPSAVVAFPGDFDIAAGGALTVGVTINERHSAEAELIMFQSKDHGPTVEFMPVLASYKYQVPLTEKWSVRGGGSVGVTRVESGGSYWYSGGNDAAFTGGVTAGASYALTKRVSLDADVLVLGLQETNYTTSGSITLLTVGVNLGF